MGAIQIQRIVIACDGEGCRSAFGINDYLASAVEARCAALNAGWRFIPQVKPNGQLASITSDVCPRCAPNWQPQPTRSKRTRGAMTHGQAKAFFAEYNEADTGGSAVVPTAATRDGD
jgi:hypothetical protein